MTVLPSVRPLLSVSWSVAQATLLHFRNGVIVACHFQWRKNQILEKELIESSFWRFVCFNSLPAHFENFRHLFIIYVNLISLSVNAIIQICLISVVQETEYIQVFFLIHLIVPAATAPEQSFQCIFRVVDFWGSWVLWAFIKLISCNIICFAFIWLVSYMQQKLLTSQFAFCICS